jgi:PXA domain
LTFCIVLDSWTGLITLLIFLGAISLSTFILQNVEARKTVQNALTSILGVNLNANKPQDESDKVQAELDEAIESFFRKIIKNFISSWYTNLSSDESFVWNLKQEITGAGRQLASRVKNVRYLQIYCSNRKKHNFHFRLTMQNC